MSKTGPTPPATIIVKVQRPLFHTGPGRPSVLVYDEGRKHGGQFPMSEDLEMLFGDEFKVYCLAKLHPGGNLTLLDLVEEQNW